MKNRNGAAATVIARITSGGFNQAIKKLNLPAERMDVPSDVDIMSYANAHLIRPARKLSRGKPPSLPMEYPPLPTQVLLICYGPLGALASHASNKFVGGRSHSR